MKATFSLIIFPFLFTFSLQDKSPEYKVGQDFLFGTGVFDDAKDLAGWTRINASAYTMSIV